MYGYSENSLTPNAGLSSIPAPDENLASITPRVFVKAREAADRANHISVSLGLVPPPPAAQSQENGKVPSLNLMAALQEMEKMLDFANGRLESVARHING